MRSFSMAVAIQLTILFFSVSALQGQTAASVLPGAGFLPGWEASYDAVAYEGDDLFFLINGGADLYMEYGFADVAAVELKHPDKGSVYMELYRMDSDSAAFGIFSLRKGGLSVEVNPGPWVVYGEDFLHLWQGPFYMSVSGGRLEKSARLQVFLSLIGHLTEKVPAENRLPWLYEEYRQAEANSAAYLMGPLALSNIYSFGHENPFRVSEGLVLERDADREIILAYADASTASDIFSGVLHFFTDNARFPQFEGSGRSFAAVDRQGKLIEATLSGNKILLAIEK